MLRQALECAKPRMVAYIEWRMQVPVGDNYYAALNSAVFSDGSFVYIPKGVKSAMELSTYFRINAKETGQVGSNNHLICNLITSTCQAAC